MEGKGKSPFSQKAVGKNVDQALKLLLSLANRGYQSAQMDLARNYEGGKALNRDLVEVYKWYKLAGERGPVADVTHINGLVLAMTHEQIQEAEKRASEWKPHETSEEEFLEVIYLRGIILKGIAGSAGKRIAVINGRPFEQGDQGTIYVGTKPLVIRCLEIKERTARVSIEGIGLPKELSLQ
jgi:TPR repeat protein